ncbi:DUF6861 domain-containing protein [Azohydromonas caseinilytica]|uniref:NAD(+)--protein-arginine ADP-ribosyltransferase Tre1-like N-terminal domain-containing protein n=1 Tax=Azohydromonas caseinilytica TaxID=2728836 RepID=A0A848F6P2_9BURK|nr:hypothetical protein [Azohydromonas caseinilytica]NML15042.1 hypothetical protein [Azohydromonas caseinilytica]
MAIFGTPGGLSQQPRGHAGFGPVAASSPGPLLGTEAEQPLSARVRCVREAYTQALLLAPAAIQRETGYRLQELLDGLLPGLLQLLIVLVASTMLGSAAGAALGALGGGVGALPGAAVGAQAGLDLGVALLAWLGLGTLALSIAQGIGPLSSRVAHALDLAWNAAGSGAEFTRIHAAAQELAQAVAELLRLVLMAIVAYLAKAPTLAATARSGGSLAELSAVLRQSRLGAGFAQWVEANAATLMSNPKLRPNKASSFPSALSDAADGRPGITAEGGKKTASAAPRGPEKSVDFTDGVPLGSRRGIAPPGLEPKALQSPGWPDLPASHAVNFNTAEPVVLKPGTKLYRVIDQKSNPAGSYWSEELPRSRAQWRSDLAVKNDWNNNGSYVEYTVPAGDGLKVWRGSAAAQSLEGTDRYLPGGGTQVWMPPGTVVPSTPRPTGW